MRELGTLEKNILKRNENKLDFITISCLQNIHLSRRDAEWFERLSHDLARTQLKQIRNKEMRGVQMRRHTDLSGFVMEASFFHLDFDNFGWMVNDLCDRT